MLDQTAVTYQGKISVHKLPYQRGPLFHATIATTLKRENKIKIP